MIDSYKLLKFLFRDHRTGRLMIYLISSHVCIVRLYVPYLPNVSTDNSNTGVDRVDEQVTMTNYSVSKNFRKATFELPTLCAMHNLAGRTRTYFTYHLNFQKMAQKFVQYNFLNLCPRRISVRLFLSHWWRTNPQNKVMSRNSVFNCGLASAVLSVYVVV
jgi:hypothetical protein